MNIIHPRFSIIQKYCNEIFDTLTEGIYISDKFGTTLYINKAYEEVSGYTAEQILGKSVQNLQDLGFYDIALNPEVISTKKESTCVQTLPNNKRVILRGFPILDATGDAVLVITFVRDITKITELHNQLREQARLIQDYHDKMSAISSSSSYSETNMSLFKSPKMLALLSKLHRLAQTDVSILLLGETGVGKDVLARMIHNASARRKKMFLKVDCGSISENLIESELFGYVPGAFSGAANKGKLGYFEVANSGTILLDEVGELPLAMQTRFLRVLQDQEVMRVGATTPQKVDVRIIAATNKNLESAISDGTFRSDLYYRLNVAVLRIPSLRERREDIRSFALYFLKKYADKYNRTITLSEEVLEAFEQYHWPGNIRELQNIIQALVIAHDIPVLLLEHMPSHVIAEGQQLSHLSVPQISPQSLALPEQSTPYSEFLQGIEKTILKHAIARLGSVNAASSFFQINRSTIFRKIHKK